MHTHTHSCVPCYVYGSPNQRTTCGSHFSSSTAWNRAQVMWYLCPLSLLGWPLPEFTFSASTKLLHQSPLIFPSYPALLLDSALVSLGISVSVETPPSIAPGLGMSFTCSPIMSQKLTGWRGSVCYGEVYMSLHPWAMSFTSVSQAQTTMRGLFFCLHSEKQWESQKEKTSKSSPYQQGPQEFLTQFSLHLTGGLIKVFQPITGFGLK